jgi:hypothetical protein
VDANDDIMRGLRAGVRRANAEGFAQAEQGVLELLLLWVAMRSALASDLAVLRQDAEPPRSFASAEASSLQRFAWHCHGLDYRLLLDNFFPREHQHHQGAGGGAAGATASAAAAAAVGVALPLLRRDAPDSMRCLIVLQASNLAHFMAWGHYEPLGNAVHPFNPLAVLPTEPALRDDIGE